MFFFGNFPLFNIIDWCSLHQIVCSIWTLLKAHINHIHSMWFTDDLVLGKSSLSTLLYGLSRRQCLATFTILAAFYTVLFWEGFIPSFYQNFTIIEKKVYLVRHLRTTFQHQEIKKSLRCKLLLRKSLALCSVHTWSCQAQININKKNSIIAPIS